MSFLLANQPCALQRNILHATMFQKSRPVCRPIQSQKSSVIFYFLFLKEKKTN